MYAKRRKVRLRNKTSSSHNRYWPLSLLRTLKWFSEYTIKINPVLLPSTYGHLWKGISKHNKTDLYSWNSPLEIIICTFLKKNSNENCHNTWLSTARLFVFYYMSSHSRFPWINNYLFKLSNLCHLKGLAGIKRSLQI